MCLQSLPTSFVPEAVQSEDCLTLNIWAPADRDAKPLPVMVWLHGGGFFAGAGSLPLYNGEKFAREGVVLVTLNYRLGRLGFFAHPSLSAEATGEPKGNFGLLDQVAALRWVRRNIGVFGGNPDNITLFGESAGALSVNYLLTSPETRGLFNRAISMSGFARTPAAPIRDTADKVQSGEEIGTAVAKGLGVEDGPDAAAKLRQLPARSFAPPLLITDALLPAPMIDGTLIRESIASAYRRGVQHDVDLMVGGVSWEASLLGHLRAHGPVLLGMTGDPARAVSLFGQEKTGDMHGIIDRRVTASLGTEPNRFQAESTAAAGNRAFLYHFSNVPEARREEWLGTPHGGELAYLFGTLSLHPANYFLTNFPAATRRDEVLGDAMRKYWTAFAKNGDPGVAGGPRWLQYTSSSKVTLELGSAGPRAVVDFQGATLDWLRQVAEGGAAAKQASGHPD